MYSIKVLLITLLLLGMQFADSRQANAQLNGLPKDQSANQEPGQAPVQKQPMFPSTQAMLRTFFDAGKSQNWKEASACLDYSEFPSDFAQTEKNDLAYKLKEILDRLTVIDINRISIAPDSQSSYRIPEDDPFAPILVSRAADGNWLFTSDTVASIEGLYERIKNRPKLSGESWLTRSFRKLSPNLLNTVFLIPTYQWICLLLLILLGFVAHLLAGIIFRNATAAWFRLAKSGDKHTNQTKVSKPIGLIAQAFTWYVGIMLIGLPPMALTVLLVAIKFVMIVSIVWSAFYLIDSLAFQMAARAEKTRTKFDDLMVPMVAKSLKVASVGIGVLLGAETFDLPIAGLIGGLGIGGAAVAFASKDAISNVFGSVTVMTDRPFEVGDWILTEGVEGNVERVGFRSTRIRTFYNSLITLPNSRLTTAVVDNMGRRRFRRIKTMIRLQYDTKPEQLEAFCEGTRELIRRHPYTRKDYFHVYLNEFNESALGVLLYCFLECPDWSIELREKHRLFVDIMRLADGVGVSFAFPTQTLHMFNEQHSSSDFPFDESDAALSGIKLAASIAGPLKEGAQLPGPVEFTGPHEYDDLPRGRTESEQ